MERSSMDGHHKKLRVFGKLSRSVDLGLRPSELSIVIWDQW